ncbi:hypothetical protein DM01DRAFT_258231 [Hesseltinella vesiculosa]|uniref:Nucleotide-diphospho-sugar transferase domain-containing protein n=1 Tax=Hesseltinella vesiculosa TaxID=101127 RepID=A0A1X2G5R9_9FUNG|nr:hypothetical protein DM01DRAFT_258231 [Hesseltinella vesiculosa]
MLLFLSARLTLPISYRNATHPRTIINVSSSLFSDNHPPDNHAASSPAWLCNCYGNDSNIPHKVQDSPVDSPRWLDDGDTQPLVEPVQTWFARGNKESQVRAVIEKNIQQPRTLLTTVATWQQRTDVYNWMASLQKTNETKFVVACLDDQLHHELTLAGYKDHAFLVPPSWLHYGPATAQTYQDITPRTSTVIVHQLLHLDITVLYADVDTIWLRPRAREYLCTLIEIRWDRTHAIFQQHGFGQQVNSGFFLMRPTDVTKRLMAKVIYLQETQTSPALTQNQAFNQVLDSLTADIRSSYVALLDVLHFPNDRAYFDEKLPAQLHVSPYLVQVRQRNGSNRMTMLKQHKLWFAVDDTKASNQS